ncbi:hypothetical protein RI129_001652 [Pyrocoelia pectoralis]|uniref:Carboxypeptidase Q n=1 Tax=Pyrocoelia pectoralis TaxID=417401 RepID=A0AAN7VXQ9_9COLE
MHTLFRLLKLLVLITIVFCNEEDNTIDKCNLPDVLKREIASYRNNANEIIRAINERFKNSTYDHLDEFISLFGNRISGSKNLENAIDYMLKKSERYNLENVHGEEAVVPHWVRGEESATLLHPRYKPLPMLGLGSSVGTPPEGICAKAVVVSSFEELKKISSKVKGKIVIYNEIYTTYGESVIYRRDGASMAAKYGAVATLISSVTPFSLATPHTGWQAYAENVTKIPTACITREDANLLHGMYKRGKTIYIKIKMDAHFLPPAISRNVIAEIKGHIDSWDVGEGAMDDGGGAFISWNALAILKAMGFRARRTIRTILWTGEEEGYIGALAYARQHTNETGNLDFVMESDIGTFTPLGLKYSGLPIVGCIIKEILNLLHELNATQVLTPADGGPDLIKWLSEGVPGASLHNENDRYFWFHHSAADTMDVEEPGPLDKATALWAAVSYIVADLTFDIPKNLTLQTHTL